MRLTNKHDTLTLFLVLHPSFLPTCPVRASIDDLMRLQLSVGVIVSANAVPKSKKLLHLKVGCDCTLCVHVCRALFLLVRSPEIFAFLSNPFAATLLFSPQVDVGEDAPREILTGVLQHYADPAALVGKRGVFVLNLEPRTMAGVASNGMMLFAQDSTSGALSMLTVDKDVQAGSSVS